MTEQLTFDYQLGIERLKALFEFDFVALALVQPIEHRFAMKWEYAAGNKSNRYRRIILQTGKGVAGIVFKTGKPMLVKDVDNAPWMGDLFNYPIVFAEDLNSFGALPLYKYNRVKGILIAGYRNGTEMTPETFEKLQNEIGLTFGPLYGKEMANQ